MAYVSSGRGTGIVRLSPPGFHLSQSGPFWGWGRSGAHGRVCALGGHRGVPETRGGPDAQGEPKFPSSGELQGRERLLGGKTDRSSLPLLDTLIPKPTPTRPPRSAAARSWLTPCVTVASFLASLNAESSDRSLPGPPYSIPVEQQRGNRQKLRPTGVRVGQCNWYLILFGLVFLSVTSVPSLSFLVCKRGLAPCSFAAQGQKTPQNSVCT